MQYTTQHDELRFKSNFFSVQVLIARIVIRCFDFEISGFQFKSMQAVGSRLSCVVNKITSLLKH